MIKLLLIILLFFTISFSSASYSLDTLCKVTGFTCSKVNYENVEDVASIRWTQYTPYFNDGEPCEFGVYDLMLRFEDDEKNEYHESHDGYCGIYSYKGSNSGLTKKNADIFHALEKCLMQNPVLLELAFGDHAEITIDKEGNVEVEEYEHD